MGDRRSRYRAAAQTMSGRNFDTAAGLEGYLSKQGGGSSTFGRKSWKVRYFVLNKGNLTYYPDKSAYQQGDQPKGIYHVLQIVSIKTMPEKLRKSSENGTNQSFREIVFPDRSLVLCCDSESILQKWVDAINLHIRAERNLTQLEAMEEEVQVVETEARRQISFTITLNVLKRWVTIDWARALTSWRHNFLSRNQFSTGVTDGDLDRLRIQLDEQKRAEMNEFQQQLRGKWEEAVRVLKEEVAVLTEANNQLAETNNHLQVQNMQLQNSQLKRETAPAPVLVASPEPDDENIVKISRQEFIELMEAAMDNSVTDDAERHNALLVSQLEQLKLQVRESELNTSRAQRESQASKERAEHLSAQLQANRVMMTADQNSVVPALPVMPSPPRHLAEMDSHNAPQVTDNNDAELNLQASSGSWISRYKAIVNGDF